MAVWWSQREACKVLDEMQETMKLMGKTEYLKDLVLSQA